MNFKSLAIDAFLGLMLAVYAVAGIFAAALFFASLASPAQAAVTATPSTLEAVLKTAPAGETVILGPGVYGRLVSVDRQPVTIDARAPDQRRRKVKRRAEQSDDATRGFGDEARSGRAFSAIWAQARLRRDSGTGRARRMG